MGHRYRRSRTIILAALFVALSSACFGLDEPFTFAVVADPHAAETARWRVDEYGSHMDRFFRCVERMEALPASERPDFLLICGDIHLWELQKRMGEIEIPLHVIAGNHASAERKREMRELFPNDFQIDGKPADYYSFRHKGALFIGMCDAATGDHVGQLASEDINPRGQSEWLERELDRPEQQKFLFAHIPPHPEGGDENMYLSRNDSRFLLDLVRETQPTAMFFGHQHSATREDTFGVTRSFTVRSCAWNFKDAPLGFLLVTVGKDGVDVREVLTSE